MSLPLLAGAAAAYLVAAWTVTPGFYDGIPLPTPYSFVCPPPTAGANVQPRPGHGVIAVVNGESRPGAIATADEQVRISFARGAFDAAGASTVGVDIEPVPECPTPPGVHFSTNIYVISATATLVKPATIDMGYSDLKADPSYVYRAGDVNGPWTNIGAGSQAQFWTINTTTDRLGYFAAGYPDVKSSGGNQLLPALVALLIFGVLLFSVPLAVVRRRSRSGN